MMGRPRAHHIPDGESGLWGKRSRLHRAGRERLDDRVLVALLAGVVDDLVRDLAVLVDHVGRPRRDARLGDVGVVRLGDRALGVVVGQEVRLRGPRRASMPSARRGCPRRCRTPRRPRRRTAPRGRWSVCSSFVQMPLKAAGKKISTTLRPRSDDSDTSSPFSLRRVKSGASEPTSTAISISSLRGSDGARAYRSAVAVHRASGPPRAVPICDP